MNDVKKWAIGVGLGALVTLGGLFMRYTVKAEVETQLAAAGYPSSAVVELMKKDIEANTERGENLKLQAEKLDNKIERIVDILLED